MILVFSPFYFWDFGSSLLILLWILFQVVYLFPLTWSCEFLPHSFICTVFLIFSFCPLLWLEGHSSSQSWSLRSASEVGPVASVGFTSGGACTCVLVGGGDRAVWGGVFWGIWGKPVCWWLGLCSYLAPYLGEVSCAGCSRQLGGAGSWVCVFLSGGQGLLPVLSCSLQDLLHLKMYSWCICGERCTPLPPAPLPSCLSAFSFCWWFSMLCKSF